MSEIGRVGVSFPYLSLVTLILCFVLLSRLCFPLGFAFHLCDFSLPLLKKVQSMIESSLSSPHTHTHTFCLSRKTSTSTQVWSGETWLRGGFPLQPQVDPDRFERCRADRPPLFLLDAPPRSHVHLSNHHLLSLALTESTSLLSSEKQTSLLHALFLKISGVAAQLSVSYHPSLSRCKPTTARSDG